MKTLLPLLAVSLAFGCAHTKPTEMSAEEHRAEADRHGAAAVREEGKYDPTAQSKMVVNRSPFADGELPITATYNPTERHREAADRQHAAKKTHLDAAKALETFESEACKAIPPPARAACPLLKPAVAQVQETSRGVNLIFKDSSDVDGIYSLMVCHLAFAQARNFETAECPLYMKGVALNRGGPKVVQVAASSAAIAAEVRTQARLLFTGADH